MQLFRVLQTLACNLYTGLHVCLEIRKQHMAFLSFSDTLFDLQSLR